MKRDWKVLSFRLINELENELDIDSAEILDEFCLNEDEKKEYRDWVNFDIDFYADLLEDIREFCIDTNKIRQNDLMICFITTFCCKYDIEVDTYQWDNLIDYLWFNLETVKENYEDKDDFDFAMSSYLC